MTQAPEDRFGHSRYLFRRQVFRLFGEAVHVYGPDGELAFYARMKGFRLREDLRLYTNESMRTEVLTLRARQILDFSAAYDVFDSPRQEGVGALKRKGLRSLVKDCWILMDAAGSEIGRIEEDRMSLALARRALNAIPAAVGAVLGFGDLPFLPNLIPQRYTIEVESSVAATLSQNFNPFVKKVELTFVEGARLDRRVGIGAALLLCLIEGRQG